MTDEMPRVDALIAKVRALGVAIPPGRVRVDSYGDSPELSEKLLALIVAGRKRAGTSLLWAAEADGDPLPCVGDIEIVVDHRNEPALLTRTVRTFVVPFDEVSAEYAAIEGEGDGSLDYWREGHWAFFTRECGRIGRAPDPRMPVVCCVFELLAVLPGPSGA